MSDRFEKFTERARKVLSLAQEEAQRFNHQYIGTEHLLLGLVREGDGVAARVLNNFGVELPKVRSSVEFIIGRGERMATGEIGLTPRAKMCIELAVDEARRLNHSYIGTEHLLLGLIREGEGIAAGVLESLGVSLERVRREVIGVLNQSPYSTPVVDRGNLANSYATIPDTPATDAMRLDAAIRAPTAGKSVYDTPATDDISLDLTQAAHEGKLDPVAGRDSETAQLMAALLRRAKRNALIIGKHGVGKTALVEGLAQRIARDDVPDDLKAMRVLWLDVAALLSSHPTTAERYLRTAINELRGSRTALFVDDIDIVLVTRAYNADLFTALLKVLLQQGGIPIICATTPDAFSALIAPDPVFASTLHPITLDPPDLAEAEAMLRAVQPRYEAHHRVRFDPAAIHAAVVLAARHLTDALPESAVDVIDTAATLVKIAYQAQNPRPTEPPMVTRADIVAVISTYTGKPEADLVANTDEEGT